MFRSPVVLSLVALAAAMVMACSGDKPADTKAPAATTTAASTAAAKAPAASTPASTGPAPRVSSIANLTLETFAVKAGTTVLFKNGDGDIPHAIVGDKNEFDSKGQITGNGFSFTFDKAGAIAYHCTIHSSMKGTITVQ